MVNIREDRSLAGLKAGFLQFAETVFAGGQAPLYRELSLEIAEDNELLALARGAKPGQYPPYLLFAAIHYLLIAAPQEPLAAFYADLRDAPGAPEEAFGPFREFCGRRKAEIEALVGSRLVQTNEVGRSACLAPAFATVARLGGDAPLHLIDIGAAAGLNLLFDRYLLDYGRFQWGEADSQVRIACELGGEMPLLLADWKPDIGHRVGIDLNPIDLTSENERRWLRALVWPEQRRRADVLTGALALAAEALPNVIRGDSVTLLPELLGQAPAGETVCVYQSYTLEYFSAEARTAFWRVLDDFGARRDLFFIEMSGIEPNGGVRLTSWRGGKREERRLADCPPHGEWLRWLG